ncbi:MAG: deoxyhypusine synthase [Candidatus Lokiarchaeota archaeon]|nr:deoxyhypusine synthase [Candidatus Lokiarchaeota archaeon]MBD3342422.1 deoxyhypusine synthase [Candidatus Lokiarchaeota archaeon]
MTNENFKDKLKHVNQFKLDDKFDILDLINNLAETGFNAKRLALACKIYENMINTPDCVKFFGQAGAMVPVGLQGVIHDFIEEGFIDILVTTGASLTHDIAETLGYHHLQGEVDINEIDDSTLHSCEMNRIYDVFLPNNVYEGIEDFVSQLEIPDYQMSVSEFLAFLGKQIPSHPKSILGICAEKEVPIFCPAFTDSGLALQLGFHHRKLNLNHFKDMLKMVEIAWDAKKAGVCIIGGGVPKNFIFQSLQFCPNSASFAIQITTDRPEPGGLSGATLQEAVSWGKISEGARQSTVISDATIALPIILWYLKKAIK